jgi:hypothetical protein
LILILNRFGKWRFDCDFKSIFWQMIGFDFKSYFRRFLNTLSSRTCLWFVCARASVWRIAALGEKELPRGAALAGTVSAARVVQDVESVLALAPTKKRVKKLA